MAVSNPTTNIIGNTTSIVFLNMKFCTHCTHKLHSAASKFHFIGAILLFRDASNLFASIIFILNHVVEFRFVLSLQFTLFSHLSFDIAFDSFKLPATISDQAFNINVGIVFD
ncbi:MAG: hypothetical protein WCG25_05000 [bacterium]